MAPYVACPCDGHTPSPHQKTCPCAQRSPGDAGGSPPHAPVPIYTTFAMTEGRNMVVQPWYSENRRCTQHALKACPLPWAYPLHPQTPARQPPGCLTCATPCRRAQELQQLPPLAQGMSRCPQGRGRCREAEPCMPPPHRMWPPCQSMCLCPCTCSWARWAPVRQCPGSPYHCNIIRAIIRSTITCGN